MPGAADGAGGGAATLGYDPKTRLTPLTVNLGEFPAQIGEEDREIAQYGWFFQWDAEVRGQHNVPMGPGNPQSLNRYAYAFGNPLRHVDPTGHFVIPAVMVVGGAVIVAAAVTVGIYYCYAAPNAAENREAVNAAASRLVNNVQEDINQKLLPWTTLPLLGAEYVRNGINILQVKGEYVPSGLSGTQRNAYRDAIHRYKHIWGIPANGYVPKEILDEMAELVKQGLSPLDAAEQVDGPPEDE